jgi:orotate phosphoribosyltransferase
MDTFLAQAIVDLQVPYFGENLRNKEDSQSCLFDPRKLLSSPQILKYIGQRMAEVIENECRGNCIIGMATSGIPWGTLCSLYTGLPFLYIRKKLERHMSSKYIEGVVPPNPQAILVDDLLFAGKSKSEAIDILKDQNIEITDILVIIDRQLERKKDGPCLEEKYGISLHSLIAMEEIIKYMTESNAITQEQIALLVRDYRQFERWRIPAFCQTKTPASS